MLLGGFWAQGILSIAICVAIVFLVGLAFKKGGGY
jgi:hypothetical protein